MKTKWLAMFWVFVCIGLSNQSKTSKFIWNYSKKGLNCLKFEIANYNIMQLLKNSHFLSCANTLELRELWLGIFRLLQQSNDRRKSKSTKKHWILHAFFIMKQQIQTTALINKSEISLNSRSEKIIINKTMEIHHLNLNECTICGNDEIENGNGTYIYEH